MRTKLLLAAAIAASTLGAIPAASAAVGIYVDTAPPAPRVEVVPAPRAGYVWAPGYWDWRSGHHVWVNGHWERERHGYYYHPSHWTQHEGRWSLEHGKWSKERYAMGDRDHDGVPNKYDRAPDNPYRQ